MFEAKVSLKHWKASFLALHGERGGWGGGENEREGEGDREKGIGRKEARHSVPSGHYTESENRSRE